MKTPVDELSSVLERLSEKLDELDARVSALERRAPTTTQPSIQSAGAVTLPPTPLESVSLPRPAAALATVGKVSLGIAGAYLLRALAETGGVSKAAVVPVAIAYAAAWLVWASLRAGSAFARAAGAITSALILSPMLWELTMRFGILAAWQAGVLAGFVVLASALAWKKNLSTVVGVTTLAAAATTLLLLVATRDPLPFACALLVMAFTTECAAVRDHWKGWLSARPVVAATGILAGAALISVYTSPYGVPPEYKPIVGAALILLGVGWFVVYATSMVFRTVGLRREISVLEIGQTSAAFLLLLVGIMRGANATAMQALGIFCLVTAVACYGIALLRLQGAAQPRTYHVFTAWAWLLFVTGSLLSLPPRASSFVLSAAAVMAALLALRRSATILGFHAFAYLTVGAAISGLLKTAAHVLAGDLPLPPAWDVWMVAATTVLCYAIAARSVTQNDPPRQRVLRFMMGIVATYVITAVVVVVIATLAARSIAASGPVLAVIRTLSLCLMALALAFAGSRWKRIELVWLAYTTIAFCTAKLLFEDLRQGRAAVIAVSLSLYGIVWILAPRLAKFAPRIEP